MPNKLGKLDSVGMNSSDLIRRQASRRRHRVSAIVDLKVLEVIEKGYGVFKFTRSGVA